MCKPYVSFSSLRNIDVSINNYLWHKENPKDSKAIRIGRAFHLYFLQPEEFKKTFIIAPKGIKFSNKDGIEWKKTFSEYYDNGMFLKYEEFETFQRMEKNILNAPQSFLLENLMNDGKVNTEILLQSELDSEIDIKGFLDFLDVENQCIIEIKTISDITKADREVKFTYSPQAYIYKYLADLNYCGNFDIVFIFVQSGGSCEVRYIRPSIETLDFGYNWTVKNIEKFKNYLSNPLKYNGFSKEIEEV